jgi:hypothetical protein
LQIRFFVVFESIICRQLGDHQLIVARPIVCVDQGRKIVGEVSVELGRESVEAKTFLAAFVAGIVALVHRVAPDPKDEDDVRFFGPEIFWRHDYQQKDTDSTVYKVTAKNEELQNFILWNVIPWYHLFRLVE